ncbi:Transcriptional regulator, XRE family [Lachnospiraceae bacterium TWA4]|nr:Transcriptional regulator, XRE family [Lachnospiraceae bacterium TWA4]
MEFSNTIKQIRKDNSLTQEGFAKKLGVTRQAISNWENNRNLPDIEMLISISKTFSISLDELILGENLRENNLEENLGGNEMTQMEEKLIQDGSENKRTKMHMVSNLTGLAFCILGIATILLKGMTVEYVDETGILHENFFLLPLGFGMIALGFITVLVGLAYYWKKTGNAFYVINKIGYITTVVFAVGTILIYANGNRISVTSVALLVLSIVVSVVTRIKIRNL